MEFEVAISFFIGGKNMRHIGEKIILVLCIVVFGIAAMNLVEIGKEYYDGQKEYEELKEYTEEKANGQQDDPTESETEEKTIDFVELRKINEDIVAWIQIPGIGLDFPVVQGEDNEYYLHHTFRKEVNKAGSIFLDYRNRADFTDQRVIIYGHHMKDGSMFGCLDKYLDRDYFEKYNEVFLFTPEEKRTYHIIAAYEHPAEHILTSYDFSTTEGINDYLRQIPDFVADSGGVIQDETEITPPLLTLSTCTRNDKQKRCLVQGILVECEKKNQEE